MLKNDSSVTNVSKQMNRLSYARNPTAWLGPFIQGQFEMLSLGLKINKPRKQNHKQNQTKPLAWALIPVWSCSVIHIISDSMCQVKQNDRAFTLRAGFSSCTNSNKCFSRQYLKVIASKIFHYHLPVCIRKKHIPAETRQIK